MHPFRTLLPLALCALVAACLALAGTATAATPPRGAFTYVGNIDDGARSGVVDRRNFVSGQSKTFATELDGGDDIAAGDVLGDAFDELVVGDDKSGRIDIHDTSSGAKSSFGTFLGVDVNGYESPDDDLAVGDTDGDGTDEIVVANTRFGMVLVYSETGEELDRVEQLPYDAGDRMVVGDFVPGRGADEIAIVSDEDNGRIDIFDLDRNVLRTAHSGFDDDGGDDVAAGDVTGDLVDEVIVANDEEGRIDSVDFAAGKTHVAGSAYDSDDNLGSGDVTGDARAEILIANTENGRVDVINFFGAGGTFGSAYDSDDEFVVGTFGSGDLDGDSIPDRVELLGLRNAQGDVLLNLKAKGASPCRKDVVIESGHMTGQVPDPSVFPNVVKTFEAATEVKPLANCPYVDVSTEEGMGLIVEELAGDIPAQAEVKGTKAIRELIDAHFRLKAPFVRHSIWVDVYVTGKGEKPAGQAGHGEHEIDFLIALGSSTPADYDEATFIHELGHSLGLDHGGPTKNFINCKPNYVSVMNYAFRSGVPLHASAGIEFDFSHEKLDTLDENALDERQGIGGLAKFDTTWTNGLNAIGTGRANTPLDWDGVDSDGNGNFADDHGTPAKPLKVDLNLRDPLSTKDVPCDLPELSPPGLTKLPGHNDWEALNTAIARPGEGDSAEISPVVEPTKAQMVEALENRDDLFFGDLTVDLRPPKPGFDAPVLGVAMDAEHVYATHTYVNGITGALDGKSVLVMLDRATLTVKATIAVGLDARAVAVNPVTRRAYVVNRGTGTGSSLSVINTLTRTVVKEVPLGQVAVDVEVNTKLNRVYISNPTQEDIQILNGATNTLLAPVQVGKGLVGMAVDEATGIVYVAMTHRSSAPNFTALGRVKDNGATRTLLPQIDLGDPLVQAQDVAIDPVRNRIYVGGLGAAGGVAPPSVTVLDRTTLGQIARIPMPGPVRAIDANPQAGAITVAGDRGVELLDADQLKITRRLHAGLAFSVVTESGPTRSLFAGELRDGKLRRLSYTSGNPT